MPKREFEYSDKNFQFLKMKVKSLTGINLADTKNELVYSRISRLLRRYNFHNFDEYCESLNPNNPQIEKEFINAITTNFTSFMREGHHFEFMKSVLLPEVIKRNNSSRKVRIWSAGCSTGEEAYSISFVVKEVFKGNLHWDIKILATDIDSDVLKTAERGLYSYDSLEHMPEYYYKRLKHFFKLIDKDNGLYEVKDEYKKIIYFKQFNLMDNSQWPMHGPFDIIFCRNVMIYFDRLSQNKIIDHFSKLLSDGGFLILGHSESVPSAMLHTLKYVDKTVYRRGNVC